MWRGAQEILPEFFRNFWVRRMALDRRNYRQLVETTVTVAQKTGCSQIVGRIVEDLKDESEPYRRMVMETIDKVPPPPPPPHPHPARLPCPVRSPSPGACLPWQSRQTSGHEVKAPQPCAAMLASATLSSSFGMAPAYQNATRLDRSGVLHQRIGTAGCLLVFCGASSRLDTLCFTGCRGGRSRGGGGSGGQG